MVIVQLLMGNLYLQERVAREENFPGQEFLTIETLAGMDERFVLPDPLNEVLGLAWAKSTDELKLAVHVLVVHDQVQIHTDLVHCLD